MKIKCFQKPHFWSFEDEVNQWIQDNPEVSIIDVIQTGAGNSENVVFLITILYEEKTDFIKCKQTDQH